MASVRPLTDRQKKMRATATRSVRQLEHDFKGTLEAYLAKAGIRVVSFLTVDHLESQVYVDMTGVLYPSRKFNIWSL